MMSQVRVTSWPSFRQGRDRVRPVTDTGAECRREGRKRERVKCRGRGERERERGKETRSKSVKLALIIIISHNANYPCGMPTMTYTLYQDLLQSTGHSE